MYSSQVLHKTGEHLVFVLMIRAGITLCLHKRRESKEKFGKIVVDRVCFSLSCPTHPGSFLLRELHESRHSALGFVGVLLGLLLPLHRGGGSLGYGFDRLFRAVRLQTERSTGGKGGKMTDQMVCEIREDKPTEFGASVSSLLGSNTRSKMAMGSAMSAQIRRQG